MEIVKTKLRMRYEISNMYHEVFGGMAPVYDSTMSYIVRFLCGSFTRRHNNQLESELIRTDRQGNLE